MKLYKYLILITCLYNCNIDTYDNITYDIIIVAGQSNTHYGLTLDIKSDVTNGNIFQLGRFSIYNHLIIDANEPLQHHTIQDNKNGFALPFTKLLDNFDDQRNPKLIIPCGRSGTSIVRDWYRKGPLYQDLIERVRFVQKKFPKSRLKVLLWHQGESDIGNSNYANLLDNFLKNIRIDLADQNLPIIVGGMVPYWAKKYEKRLMQQKIIKETPQRISNTAYADPEIPFIIEKKDNTFDEVHYDAEGQRELGQRYFDAYLKLYNGL